MSDDDDLFAAELALGLIEGDARAQALRRALAEPAFGRRVGWWRERFAALAVGWPEADAPADLEPRIVAAVQPAPVPAAAGWWRWVTLAATAVAAALLVALLLRPERIVTLPAAPTPASLVASLTPSHGPAFSAVYDVAHGEIRLAALPALTPGRDAEAWAIGGDGVPHSIGLATGQTVSRIAVSARARALLVPGATLAISAEPRGGSPLATPSGPVIASGPIAAI